MAWSNNNGQIRVGVRQTLVNNQSQVLYSLVTSGLSLNLDSTSLQSYSGVGVNWNDLSGNGNNGTLLNGISYNSGLMTLDGSDDYVDFGNNSLLYNAYNNQFTQEFSIRLKSNASSFKTIFRVDDWSRISINISTSQIFFKIGYDNGSPQSDTLTLNYQFNYNQWYVISVVWSKLNTQKIYVDGVLVAQRTPTLSNYVGIAGTSGGANIGRGHSSPYSNHINCDISTFRHYNRVLSDVEILENFNYIKGRLGYSTLAPILDTYSGSLFAYSLRKLKTGATQSIRVRRSSDNAEMNIGFNSNGALDTTSLLSFVGSGNGFVSTFYDQSGNGYNMVQSTSVRQPQIVSSGCLITSDGRVAMQYDGVDDYMVNFNSNFSGEDKSITTVNVVDVLTAKYSEILSMGYSGSGTGLEFFTNFILGSGTQYYAGKRDNSGNIKTSTFGVVTTGPQLLTSYSSGTTNNNRKNGSLINTFDVNVGSITIDNLSIGALVRNTIGGYSNIKSMEVIIYSTDKSSSISGIEDSINSYYNLWGGIVNSGLVLNLDANKTTSYSGTGTTWTDISGNGNNGTLVNGVGYSSSNGSIITFDGVNDYVSINGLANYLNNKTNFSYETWFKVNNTTTFGTLFSFGNNDNYSNDIIFFISGNQICVQVNNGADGGAVASFTSTGWNSMSVVYDGGQTGNANRLKLYINGILQTLTFGSYNVPSSTSNTSMVNSGIGAYSTGNWNNFLNGSIGSSRLYTKSLSASEIQQNFNALKSRFGL